MSQTITLLEGSNISPTFQRLNIFKLFALTLGFLFFWVSFVRFVALPQENPQSLTVKSFVTYISEEFTFDLKESTTLLHNANQTFHEYKDSPPILKDSSDYFNKDELKGDNIFETIGNYISGLGEMIGDFFSQMWKDLSSSIRFFVGIIGGFLALFVDTLDNILEIFDLLLWLFLGTNLGL